MTPSEAKPESETAIGIAYSVDGYNNVWVCNVCLETHPLSRMPLRSVLEELGLVDLLELPTYACSHILARLSLTPRLVSQRMN